MMLDDEQSKNNATCLKEMREKIEKRLRKI
jgi:hypothetical protein